ncbi:hypothetical protein ACEPAH_967 [Sanghuangporus vaninii]
MRTHIVRIWGMPSSLLLTASPFLALLVSKRNEYLYIFEIRPSPNKGALCAPLPPSSAPKEHILCLFSLCAISEPFISLTDFAATSMVVEQLPDYLPFPPAMDQCDDQRNGYNQHGVCLLPAENKSQVAVVEQIPVDGNQSALEDAELILGRNVAFSIIPSDDAFDVQEVVETLSNAPANSNRSTNATTTICVPRNKVASFNEALREHLVRRSRRVVERAGRIAFWRGKEPFMRPVLSRSLSLP